MKAIRVLAVLIIAGLAGMVQAATPTVGEGDNLKIEVFVTNLGGGQWEYQYDISGRTCRGYEWYTPFDMRFDFNDGGASTIEDNILNMYDNPSSGQKELHEYWTMNGVTGNKNGGWGARWTGFQPSYGDLATDTWIILPTVPQADAEAWVVDPVYALAYGFANPFHLPSDYTVDLNNPLANTSPETATNRWACFGIHAGVQADLDGDGYEDDLELSWPTYGPYPGPGWVWEDAPSGEYGLLATIRIVSDLGPSGSVQLMHYTGGTHLTSPAIVAPGAPNPGDFDGDGDVDADDIDALCANMTGDGVLLPSGFEQYDLDGDGDADSADMDILIHDLVETTVGIGTEYGDFNLDGKIDTVDLTILGTYFGVGTSWNQGNANCDTTVDTVDLTILGTYFGFVASAPIPEPATMTLLAIGGLAILRRKRS